ncbi:MAG: histidine triad nucleotide-binding protein [Anaerolineales bacterium]|nr:histidine triad nucleotide-binding protein [Anaerolineales bacterium]
MSQETLFTRIINGQIPATFVHRDEDIVAIRDINPQAPTHILVIPVKPLPSLAEAGPEDEALLGRLLLTAKQVAEQEGLAESGYRVVINVGSHGGQAVPHLHVHLLGGRRMTWPPG